MLEIDDLSLAINGKPILKQVSLAVERGRILGVIGESGSGKTLTALSVMQLLPPGSTTSGRILLDGVDLLSLTEAQMCEVRGRQVGFVFQEPMTALNPVQTIGDQVAETLRVHDQISRRRAAEKAAFMLARVGLDPQLVSPDRYPHELSGGQRQRVVMAMAVVLRPPLLIADEPTTALDVTTQAELLEMLRELVGEFDMGLLFITHDLALVSEFADDVVIMRHGEVVDHGPVREVFSSLSHPYTQQLYRASTHAPQRHSSIAAAAPLLQVQGIVREYRQRDGGWWGDTQRFRAVDDVSFSIARGESVGLVGESGCGKSTLARAILGLDRVQQGSIRIDGEEVRAGQPINAALRRKLQAVFQDPFGSFNPRHRVERLVAEPCHLLQPRLSRRQRRQRVDEALVSVGLEPQDRHRYIHEFSGGQRQRIAIARALIIRPALIVLDEAVSALDVSIRAQILDLLASLADSHELAYLFIAHDLSVVRNVTDRVLVMQQGRIVEHGDTEIVFTAPGHPYTQALIAAIPRFGDADVGYSGA